MPVCANRLYVQAGVYDAFAEKLVEAVKKLKVVQRKRKRGGIAIVYQEVNLALNRSIPENIRDHGQAPIAPE